MSEPVRQLRPSRREVLVQVGRGPDATLRRFRVGPEVRDGPSMEVEAFGIGGAMDMACDRWPDEGAWWGEVVE